MGVVVVVGAGEARALVDDVVVRTIVGLRRPIAVADETGTTVVAHIAPL